MLSQADRACKSVQCETAVRVIVKEDLASSLALRLKAALLLGEPP